VLTTDTATNIISALSGSVDNSNFEFTVVNLAAFDVTIAVGTGVTLVGNMVVNDGSATFRVRRLTSSTVSITRLERGGGGIFTKIYESAGQTITSAGLLTLSHGLGVEPKVMQFTLQCTTAELGYSIGDRLMVTSISTNTRAQSITSDSSNIVIRFSDNSTPFAEASKTTGIATALTNSNWQLYVRAFA